MNDKYQRYASAGEAVTVGEALAAERRRLIVIAPKDGSLSPWEGGINGHFFRIKRCEPVEVPESVAALIEQNERVEELRALTLDEYRLASGKKLGGAL
ncbi:MAG: hypothetical protein Q4B99_02190 [Clostridia bacterium]|nr:hypothetical protein [Clostridia bacterium]